MQTLLYAPSLESRLRLIRSKSEAAIEETGANILYLAIGFLEWYESEDSDKKRMSPLFTLPVQLTRASRPNKNAEFTYKITLKGDGLVTNITLKQLLHNDFDLFLPDVSDSTNPEDYFQEIKNTILTNKPRWRVRRQASLVLLNFSKQVIYNDLNPKNWPNESSIEDHPVISRMFGGEEAEGNSMFPPDDYSVDGIAEIHESYPLIDRADTSQHSALIDAVKGGNLVIIGPPGSGKSQTITNMIAALISNGKRVLFVAEKMAALNVVKERLDDANLGDFCLELHSHKTNKQKILNDLNSRLLKHKKFRSSIEIEIEINFYEKYKKTLNTYAAHINSEWKSTGLTVHEILMKTARYREELNINPEDYAFPGIDGDSLTIFRCRELTDEADVFKRAYNEVSSHSANGEIKQNIWYGLTNTKLVSAQSKQLIDELTKWNSKLSELHDYWEGLNVDLHLDMDSSSSLEDISEVIKMVDSLPELIGNEPLLLIPSLINGGHDVANWLSTYKTIHSNYPNLLYILDPSYVLQPETVNYLKLIKTKIHEFGIVDKKKIGEFKNIAINIDSLQNDLAPVSNHLEKIGTVVSTGLSNCFKSTMVGVQEFGALIMLMNALDPSLWRHRDPIYDNSDLDPLLKEITNALNVLTPLHAELNGTFNLSLPPLLPILEINEHLATYNSGGLFKWFSSQWRASRITIRELSSLSKPKIKRVVQLVPSYIKYLNGLASLDKVNKGNPAFADIYDGVNTPIDQANALREWYRLVRQEYGYGFNDRAQIGDELISLEQNLAVKILGDANNGLLGQVQGVTKTLENIRQVFAQNTLLSDQNSDLKYIVDGLSSHCDLLHPLIAKTANGDEHSFYELTSIIDDVIIQQNRVLDWVENPLTEQFSNSEFNLNINPNKVNSAQIRTLDSFVHIFGIVSSSAMLTSSFFESPTEARYKKFGEIKHVLGKSIQDVIQSKESFYSFGEVIELDWLAECSKNLNSIIERNKHAVDNPDWLHAWLQYIHVKAKLVGGGKENIISKIESREIDVIHMTSVIKLVMYYYLAQEILAEDSFVSNFNGIEQMEIREKFQQVDTKIMQLQSEVVAYNADQVEIPSGVSTGKIGNYTERSLLLHNIGLKRPRISIRKLIRNASKSIQALTPCLMMSPMSVAQYLVPGKYEFDVVIMDEASQIRPEDALGAIARGKQIIVVGDPKQLPPTNFFQRVDGNLDDDESMAIQQTESILETVQPTFRNRLLQWHYRSQHESLIDFSNQKFYDSKLIVFPSPFNQSEEFGIHYERVRSGFFSARRNINEAKAIVLAIADQMAKYPTDSIGVVAMNSEQCLEIERQFEQLVKDQPKLAELNAINQESERPLFIKNLENVQGDERDVIIISMTYGPEKQNLTTMHQRFGPINSQDGWRRLNVLFTRSKKRMLVYSSMNSGFIITHSTSSRGVVALKNWLEYCETKHIPQYEHNDKAPDSDFEIAVMNSLREHGYECEPQLGVAGFYLDIAVRDPGMPGRFLLGIECDGATYHSAKSARDRDRLRQEILESRGWEIYRIWSTDWFFNPSSQLTPILKILEKLKTAVRETLDSTINLTASINNDSGEEESIVNVQFNEVQEDFYPRSTTDYENVESSGALEDQLINYRDSVIKKQFPDTSVNSRLLRDNLLEALVEYKPVSKNEFLEVIPDYLRIKTSREEAKAHLDIVLQIIAKYD